MDRHFLVGVTMALAITGCAGVSPVQVGQTAGTIAGGAIAPGIGAPLGALVGLLAGMVVQGEVDKSTEQRERRDLGKQLARGSHPTSDAALPEGMPTRVWVDETVHKGRLIAGRFETRHLQ